MKYEGDSTLSTVQITEQSSRYDKKKVMSKRMQSNAERNRTEQNRIDGYVAGRTGQGKAKQSKAKGQLQTRQRASLYTYRIELILADIDSCVWAKVEMYETISKS